MNSIALLKKYLICKEVFDLEGFSSLYFGKTRYNHVLFFVSDLIITIFRFHLDRVTALDSTSRR